MKEELKHEGRTSIERDEALTEGSIHVENEIDLVFPNTEKKKEVPIFLGQTLLAIGDVVIEVQKGMVTLRCGKEEDVLKVLNSTQNTSFFFLPILLIMWSFLMIFVI